MDSPAEPLLGRLYNLVPIGLAAGLTLAWCATPSVPVLVRGMGVLTPPEARQGFYARSAAEVQALLVREGQQVQVGQPLLTLNQISQSAPGPRSAGQAGAQATAARLTAVAQQLRGLRVQQRAIDSQQQALQRRREQIETTNRPVRGQMQALEDLRRDGVIAPYSPLWVAAQDLWLRNKADLATIDAGLAQLGGQRAALHAQAAELIANRELLRSEERSQVVRAPASGRVLDLAVQNGQPVAPGQKLGLLGLPPRHPGRLAVVLFTAADATRLEVGDAVLLNPQLLSRDSFGSGEQRYGLVPGRLLSLSSDSVSLEDVTVQVGSQEQAANLMASARQQSYGEGGDLTSQLPGRSGAALVLAVVQLQQAATASGLAWTRGPGPQRPLPMRTPTEAEAEVEKRTVLSYLGPFWRWISGARA
ncbi:MAG: biotin/lipoyl-binding protein [Cyanobium sp.]